MFVTFYLVKSLKIANNPTTTQDREKNAQLWNPEIFKCMFD
jgi:hypothetical protein